MNDKCIHFFSSLHVSEAMSVYFGFIIPDNLH